MGLAHGRNALTLHKPSKSWLLTRGGQGSHHSKIILVQVIAELLTTLLTQNGPRIPHFCKRSLAVETASDNF